MATEEIRTFEELYKSKKLSEQTRVLAKEILKKLYIERDDYAAKAKYYGALYHRTKERE